MSIDTHANPHHEHPDVVGSRNRLGVILLLVADIAFALSMVFVFFYLKGQNVNDMWLPKATEDSPAILAVSSKGSWNVTGICALGLIFHFLALSAVRKNNQSQLKTMGFLAFLAAVVGLGLQVELMASAPFTFYSGGAYASCYYMFVILNIVHLAFTSFIALGNWNRSRLGLYKSDHWHVDIVNLWWIWMTMSSLLGAFSLSFA